MPQPLALFDLDNTLVDRTAALADCVTEYCATANYGPEIAVWLSTELADRAAPTDFTRLREVFGLPETGEQLWQRYVETMASAVSCRPEVLEALAELRSRGWTVGVVTNGASDIQRAKLRATGLADLSDGVAVSGDLEVRKPDQRLFALAARECGTILDRGGWMIGDNPAGDIGGGHEAGLHTIWLRGRPWPDGLPAAHHVVDDVTDAITILLNETWE
ncbi:HAD family hydrolase [Streptomyces sp. NPDC048442]|uniref:HAD family hydrolase n=1 Tax=Streptomyces sp. NPDC048442 TaxID=3154823 RepID=UPI00344667CC